MFAGEETVYDADLCAPPVRTVELLDPNEGSKYIITVLMQGVRASEGARLQLQTPLLPLMLFPGGSLRIQAQEKTEKMIYFKYFLLVFSPLIMHSDGETLGLILIYIQSSFFASPPTHPPFKCIS